MAGTGFETGSGEEPAMPRIVKTPDVLGGDPRIEGHRVGVYHVYQQYVDGGATAEKIATGFGLSVAEVHAALAYAFDNAAEMRAIEERKRELRERDASNRAVPDEGR